MSKKDKMCVVRVNGIEMIGKIIEEYEEIGGPDDGAIFATIELENGQTITAKIIATGSPYQRRFPRQASIKKEGKPSGLYKFPSLIQYIYVMLNLITR